MTRGLVLCVLLVASLGACAAPTQAQKAALIRSSIDAGRAGCLVAQAEALRRKAGRLYEADQFELQFRELMEQRTGGNGA